MKNLLLTLLITLSTTILAKTPVSLFGVYINDNVLDYVTQEELKSKWEALGRGFYTLELKNLPVSNMYVYVVFDKNNKIVHILSQKEFQNIETCKQVEYGVRRALEKKYNFEFDEIELPRMSYSFQELVEDNVMMTTQCLVISDDITMLSIAIQTEEYLDNLF